MDWKELEVTSYIAFLPPHAPRSIRRIVDITCSIDPGTTISTRRSPVSTVLLSRYISQLRRPSPRPAVHETPSRNVERISLLRLAPGR